MQGHLLPSVCYAPDLVIPGRSVHSDMCGWPEFEGVGVSDIVGARRTPAAQIEVRDRKVKIPGKEDVQSSCRGDHLYMESLDGPVHDLARARPIFDYLGRCVQHLRPSAGEGPPSRTDAVNPEHI